MGPGTFVTQPRPAQVPLSEEEQAAQKAVPDKLAIGVQGGFDVQAKTYTVEKSSSVVDVTTGQAVPLPNSALPEAVLACIAAVEVSPVCSGASVLMSLVDAQCTPAPLHMPN